MAYCDFEYYKNTYFGNLIKEIDFPRLAKRASDKIDAFTFGHLHITSEGIIKYTWENSREFNVEDISESVQNKVKDACCALAEKIADIEIANQTIRSAGGAGISSVSSGSESISFGNSVAVVSNSEIQKACYSIVREYLAGTGLLYAGI